MTRHRQRRNTRLRLSGLRGHKTRILHVRGMALMLHKMLCLAQPMHHTDNLYR